MEIFKSKMKENAANYNKKLREEKERAMKHLIEVAKETLEEVKKIDVKQNEQISVRDIKMYQSFLKDLINGEMTDLPFSELRQRYSDTVSMDIMMKFYSFDNELDAVEEIFLYYYEVPVI